MTNLTQLLILCLQEVITCLQRCLSHLVEYNSNLTPVTSTTASEADRAPTPDLTQDPLTRCQYCARRRVYGRNCDFHLTKEQSEQYHGRAYY
jgi:hypothetical protein